MLWSFLTKKWFYVNQDIKSKTEYCDILLILLRSKDGCNGAGVLVNSKLAFLISLASMYLTKQMLKS